MTGTSKLEVALARGLVPGGDLVQELASLNGYAVRTTRDAHAICLALARLIELPPEMPEPPFPPLVTGGEKGGARTALDWLASLFQQVETQEAYGVLLEFGLPQLLRLFDEHSTQVDHLFLLKLCALYRHLPGTERVMKAARSGLQAEGRLWSVIFRQFDLEHPHINLLVQSLHDPLPNGFIGVAYLDWSNTLALAEKIKNHPFDSLSGVQRLHQYLTDTERAHFSFAQSAAASLPFISHPLRQNLLALALDHPCGDVQMEGAWASAKLGSSAGVQFLARTCLDPVRGKQAAQYLRELDAEEAIPVQALDPSFQAQLDLTSWLAHPDEFGRPPDEISLMDTRELYWPPCRDRRRVWLFRYRYQVAEDRISPGGHRYDVGVGMVGSITFSLIGETCPEMLAEDIYALHCCWELEYRHDPHAPPERSIEVGRRLLSQHQPGFIS
jgi:hypothetical protein